MAIKNEYIHYPSIAWNAPPKQKNAKKHKIPMAFDGYIDRTKFILD